MEKRHRRKLYNEAINENDDTKIISALQHYITAQENTRKAIQRAEQQRAQQVLETISNSGGTNSKMFWALRRRCSKPDTDEQVDRVRLENGNTTTVPEAVKETVATYFEQLYTTHDRELFDEQWTQHIESCIARWQNDTTYDEWDLNRAMSLEEIEEVVKNLKNAKSSSSMAGVTSRPS